MEYKIYRTDELYHHGIKGMRWGIRRFQRKDGSLTPAGQKRRARLEAELKQLGPKKRKTKAEVEQGARKKTVYEMTDAELRERTNRMRIEKEYYDAQKNLAAANPVQISKGKKFMNSLMTDVVAPAAKNAGRAWLENFMKDKLGLNKKSELERLEETWKKMDYKKKIKDAQRGIEDNPLADLEEQVKKAKAEFEIADYNKKRENAGKPDKEKIDWESRNKEQTNIKDRYKTEKARRDWDAYQEDIEKLGPEEAWKRYTEKQGGN